MSRRKDPAGADPESESELVRRCIAGEDDAQSEFYRRFRRQVAANLYRVMGRPDEVDDLLQEVFLIAFRGLEKFRSEAKLSTWLYRISVNVALGRIRQKKRRPPHLPVDNDILEARGEAPPTPAAELASAQARARVYRILEKMPAKKRIVLYLHEIEGRDLKEIAYLVDANPVTVRTRLFYGKKEFYKLLAEDEESAQEPSADSAGTSKKGKR